MILTALCLLVLAVLGGLSGVQAAPSGRVIINKKGKGGKPSFGFLLKSFFGTLIDPTYSGEIKVSKVADKGKAGGKGRKGKAGSGSSVFGEGGAAFGGGSSFGPVCGPNGCT